MNRRLPLTQKYWHLMLWPFLALVSILLIVWSPRGFMDLRHLQLEYQELVQKNRALQQENHLLYEQIDRLANDPEAVEHLARQELGLVKEGELLFLFPTKTPESAP